MIVAIVKVNLSPEHVIKGHVICRLSAISLFPPNLVHIVFFKLCHDNRENWYCKVRQLFQNDGSSRSEVFCRKGVLRNFTKFTRKHLYQSLFFSKFVGVSLTKDVKERIRRKKFVIV